MPLFLHMQKSRFSHDTALIVFASKLIRLFHSINCKIAVLTLKVPNTKIAEFENTADPYETAHDELSHLDLQCLSSSL